MDFYTCEISVAIRDSFYFCIHDMYKARNKENLNSTLTCAFILYYSVVSNKSDRIFQDFQHVSQDRIWYTAFKI